MLEGIEGLNDTVKDPQSEAPQQPTYIDNIYRSLQPEIAVLVGLCTHLGCVPSYRSEVAPAGRVYAAQPAPLNLEVPPYRFDDDSTLTIGLDPEGA